MSPQEQALSQRVLEFLIAKQDWFMLDIAPFPEGSVGTIWGPRVSGDTGFEGKWTEATQFREGPRVGTPNVNAEAGPSVQRGPPKKSHPQAQAHVQAPLPRLAYAQFQRSQMQPQPQPTRLILEKQQHSTSRTTEYGSDADYVMVLPNWISQKQSRGGSGFLVGRGTRRVRLEERKRPNQ